MKLLRCQVPRSFEPELVLTHRKRSSHLMEGRGQRLLLVQPRFGLSALQVRCSELSLSCPMGWKPAQKMVLQRCLEVTISPVTAWPAPRRTWLRGFAGREDGPRVAHTSQQLGCHPGAQTAPTCLLLNCGLCSTCRKQVL